MSATPKSPADAYRECEAYHAALMAHTQIELDRMNRAAEELRGAALELVMRQPDPANFCAVEETAPEPFWMDPDIRIAIGVIVLFAIGGALQLIAVVKGWFQ